MSGVALDSFIEALMKRVMSLTFANSNNSSYDLTASRTRKKSSLTFRLEALCLSSGRRGLSQIYKLQGILTQHELHSIYISNRYSTTTVQIRYRRGSTALT